MTAPLLTDPKVLAERIYGTADGTWIATITAAIIADRLEIRRAMRTRRDAAVDLRNRRAAKQEFQLADYAEETAAGVEEVAIALFGADWEVGL